MKRIASSRQALELVGISFKQTASRRSKLLNEILQVEQENPFATYQLCIYTLVVLSNLLQEYLVILTMVRA